MSQAWYEIIGVEELATPALVVYPNRVQANLDRAIQLAGGVERLRPHVKTHKMAEVLAMHLAAGVRKFKTATLAETELVARSGADDVLAAYPLVGPNAGKFAALVKAYPQVCFSTVFDDLNAVQALSQALQSAELPQGKTVEVLLEIDPGMHRTGIEPGEAAERIYTTAVRLPCLAPGGFHVYDGHIRDLDFAARCEKVEAAFRPVAEMKRRLEAAGVPVPHLVCGGTPTFTAHALHLERELSPGTYVFWDAGYTAKFPELPFEPAAVVLTRVVSKPGADLLCLDLGYKAVASDNPDPRVLFPQLPDAQAVVHSEEHLVVRTSSASEYPVGAVLYGVPWHICPTCALHHDALIVVDRHVTTRWPVAARNRVLAPV